MNRPKVARLQGQLTAQQSKQSGVRQSSSPVAPRSVNASSPPTPKQPAAPPAYRPQLTPRVAQTKPASPGQHPPSSQPRHSPVAPPVYRPSQTKIAQPKMAGTNQQAPTAQPARTATNAPPVYHPQPTPRVLQLKQANARPAPGQQPSTRVQRPPQIPQAAQARMPQAQKPADHLRKPAAPVPVTARHLPQTHGSNIQCRPASANGLQPPKQPAASRPIGPQARYTIQMVPIKVGEDTFDTKSDSDTQKLRYRLHDIFRNNPNSRELEYIYRNINVEEAEDEDEWDNTAYIKHTLLGGMLQADRVYIEQIRSLNAHAWQSASVRIYVDHREVEIMSWRNHGTPVQLSHQEKLDKSKQDKQSISKLKDDEGFQSGGGRHQKRKQKQDIQISAGDAEKQAIDQFRIAMGTQAFRTRLHGATQEVFIRFVSFLGACDACKGRIQVLLQDIRRDVPEGIPILLSFFYQQSPKSKVRGKGVHTNYGWEEDVESTELGYGGFYIHDFTPVVGTWVDPKLVSNSSSSFAVPTVVKK